MYWKSKTSVFYKTKLEVVVFIYTLACRKVVLYIDANT